MLAGGHGYEVELRAKSGCPSRDTGLRTYLRLHLAYLQTSLGRRPSHASKVLECVSPRNGRARHW